MSMSQQVGPLEDALLDLEPPLRIEDLYSTEDISNLCGEGLVFKGKDKVLEQAVLVKTDVAKDPYLPLFTKVMDKKQNGRGVYGEFQYNIAKLAGTTWLDDGLMQEYIDTLDMPVDMHFYRSFCDFGPTYKYSKLRNVMKASVDIFRTNRIAILVNRDKQHWGLLYIDMEEHRIFYFDSLTWPGEIHALNCLKWLLQAYWEKNGTVLPDLEKWKLHANPFPNAHQFDGGNCGVYALMYLECLVHRLCPSRVKNVDGKVLKLYRLHVGSTLVKCCVAYRRAKTSKEMNAVFPDDYFFCSPDPISLIGLPFITTHGMVAVVGEAISFQW
jgi:hypothetical protein